MLSPDFASSSSSSSWGVRLGLVLLLLLLVGGPEGEAAQREDPPPCKEGRECLGYAVACRGSGYEGRRYPASSWVGTRVEGLAYLPSLVKGFWRLFRYIQGKNEQNATIPMTSPVLTRVRENSDNSGGEAFEVYFMVPEAFREEPPKPTEETVFLETFPQLQAYVRFFGGWMSDRVRQAQLAALDSDLRRDGRAAVPGVHFTAGFNSPFELFDRRNEVWRLAEGDLGCGGAGPEE